MGFCAPSLTLSPTPHSIHPPQEAIEEEERREERSARWDLIRTMNAERSRAGGGGGSAGQDASSAAAEDAEPPALEPADGASV